MTLRESIELNERNGVKHTPELKGGRMTRRRSPAIFGSQEQLRAESSPTSCRPRASSRATRFPQSFNVNDVLYWVKNTAYGRQAVFLVDYDAAKDNILLFDTTGKQLENRADQLKFFAELRKREGPDHRPGDAGAPRGQRQPRRAVAAAKDLKAMGFDIITWTFERADLRQGASQAGFYFDFDPTGAAIKKDSDMYKALDVLAREVKILGIFSDWPATVTYYANCMNLK